MHELFAYDEVDNQKEAKWIRNKELYARMYFCEMKMKLQEPDWNF